jgi:hypothetical protein
MLDVCETCRKRGRCRMMAELARLIIFAWARGESAPDCPDHLPTYQARLAA